MRMEHRQIIVCVCKCECVCACVYNSACKHVSLSVYVCLYAYVCVDAYALADARLSLSSSHACHMIRHAAEHHMGKRQTQHRQMDSRVPS